jgi:hypothetical protein
VPEFVQKIAYSAYPAFKQANEAQTTRKFISSLHPGLIYK